MRRTVVALLVATLLVPGAAAVAKGKPEKPTSSPAPTASTSSTATPVTTQWLLPKITAEPVEVKAGSTIAMRFRLVSGSTEIKSTSGVGVTLTGMTCPTAGPTATGTIAPVRPGKSTKAVAAAFRYLGNSFNFQWKSAKNTAPGCYRVAVTGPVALTGPIIRINN